MFHNCFIVSSNTITLKKTRVHTGRTCLKILHLVTEMHVPNSNQCSKLEGFLVQPKSCTRLFVRVFFFIYSYQYVRKSMHTLGAQVLKSVHLALKTCTQGAPLISNAANTDFFSGKKQPKHIVIGNIKVRLRVCQSAGNPDHLSKVCPAP